MKSSIFSTNFSQAEINEWNKKHPVGETVVVGILEKRNAVIAKAADRNGLVFFKHNGNPLEPVSAHISRINVII